MTDALGRRWGAEAVRVRGVWAARACPGGALGTRVATETRGHHCNTTPKTVTLVAVHTLAGSLTPED